MAYKCEVIKHIFLIFISFKFIGAFNNYYTLFRDWCISRQLWWGHRIPAYCVTNKDVTTWIIARSEKDARLMAEMKYGNDVEICQDSDVLDTWFSSAIIPFVIFGWPKSVK